MYPLEEEEPVGNKFNEALQEFRRARLAADLEQLRARLTGKSTELLSYEEVRRMLHAGMPTGKRELRDIPLDAIVGSVDNETVTKARHQLAERGVEAEFVHQGGEIVPVLLQVISQRQSDLVIMGGYGFTPLLEVVLGSAVDEILRTTEVPVLVCR